MRAPEGGDDGRRYRIVRRLGHGGMAEVFEAVLSGTHGFTRRVAIKRISTRAADDPELAERFLDEARIASQLHHAGIVGVIDYGFVDGLPFQVLEFVDGLDADKLIDRAGGALPVDVALIIAADVARALDHAHRATGADGARLGIVHRDVKPANVLVSWDGDVKLSDFGIAMARDRVAVTEAGVARGTPWFMAPEQRTKSEIGPRTDVFALGCTLHALLTGKSPLVDFEVAMTVIAGDPAPLDPSLPPELAAVIARAVAPAPEQRFADCGAFADALGRLLAQRLDRDARGRLRDYLASLRKPAGGGGLLDQLLAVDLVLAGDSNVAASQPGTREFTLRATQLGEAAAGAGPGAPPAIAEAPLLPVLAPPPALADELEPESEPEPEPPRRRSRVPLLVGGLVALGVASVGIGIAIRDPGRASSTVTADAALVAFVAEPMDAALPAFADAPAQPPADAPPAADARPERHRADASKRERADADRTTPPPSDGTGWVVISAAGGRARAQIVIDGKKRDFVPNPVEVSIGRHELVLIKENGDRLGPITIEVTAYHQPEHPLRPKFK